MKLAPNFALDEVIASETATRLGIDNDLPADLLPNARASAAMMQRIRDFLSAQAGRDIPITITSWYRCLPLNRALRSGDGSDHVLAAATDWRAPAFGTPMRICQVLAPHVDALGIGQLINEFPDRRGWVHTSTRMPTKMVNRIITITGRGTFVGVVQ